MVFEIATQISPEAGAAVGFGAVAAIFFVFFLFAALGVLLFVFWLWMLIDCIKRKFKDDTEKIIWVLLMVFLGVLASIIYYFVVYRETRKKS